MIDETLAEGNDAILSCVGGVHRVYSLPYWDRGSLFPCMHAGTVPTGINGDDHNMFYWLYRNLNSNGVPLVLWFNGGPGSSS